MPEENPSTGSGQAPQGSTGGGVDQNRMMAAIGYLGPLFLVPMLALPKDRFAQFHARQGMVLFIAEVLVWFVFDFLFISAFGFGGYFIWSTLSFLLWVGTVILTILGFVNAYQGKEVPLPVIGGLAPKPKM